MDEPTQRHRALLLALLLSYGGGFWLALTHHGLPSTSSGDLTLATDGFWVATLALLPLRGAVGVARRLGADHVSWGVRTGIVVVTAAPVLASVSVLRRTLFMADPPQSPLAVIAMQDLIIAATACLVIAGVATHLQGSRTRPRSDLHAGPAQVKTMSRRAPVAVGITALTAISLAATPVAAAPQSTAAAAAQGVCSAATRTITYEVEALSLDLPLNGWGDHVPDAMMYALSNDDALVSADDIRAEPGRATPLVLRAAVGDCIQVTLKNSLSGKRVGMHVDGVAKEVTGPNASDGANIGRNDDSTVAPGGSRTYTWYAGRKGQFVINDYGSGTDYGRTDPSQDTTSRGLYGALVVVEKGFTWHDPVTGTQLLSGGRGIGAPVFADVRGPGQGDDYRDIALLFLDEPEGVLDKNGRTPRFPHTGIEDVSFGFNYRTEPLRNRLQAVIDHNDGKTVTLPNGTVILPEDNWCDGWTVDQTDEENLARLAKDRGISACHGEESHLQSWPFGDPGKLSTTVDETDVLEIAAGGGTFTLTLQDPTVPRPLGDDLSSPITGPAFPGQRATTDPIPFDASADVVEDALLALKVLPLADLAPGDISVTSPAAGRYVIDFAQHFAGRDVELTVDGDGLLPVPGDEPDAPAVGPTAEVSDTAEGARKGRIDVMSDALIPHAYRGDPVHVRLIHPGVKETHPFHQHTNRWRQESEDAGSTRLDVQSISPGQAMDLVYEGGAGEAITSDPADSKSSQKSAAEWLEAGRPDLAALAISKASNGDQIFHCHLYPHFAQGFWGMLRVFDRQRPIDAGAWPVDVPRTYRDGTPMEPLALLPDLDLSATRPGTDTTVHVTPLPDAAHPGFPIFVKGEYGQRAYRPPGAVVADQFGSPTLNWRRPGDTVRGYDSASTTNLERANMITTQKGDTKQAIPGSFFIDPCPQGVPVRRYYPAAVDAKIVYNSAGWHDPSGKLYVEAPPKERGDPLTAIDVAGQIRDRIEAGEVATEPYNMRANLGDCVIMQTTNATHLDNDPNVPADVHDGQFDGDGAHGVTGGNAFHLPMLMSELSTHVHLVRFDELGTDGTSVGWNYVQAPMVGQSYSYRWFVDVPLRTVYFHDHQNPNTHQQHGLWAAMNVEPATSVWHSSTSGTPLTPDYCEGLGLPGSSSEPACYGVGAVADIKVPGTKSGTWSASFREFTVNYSDFVPLLDAAGDAINPPGEPDDFATDQGGMAINYRNEPFPTRINSSTSGLRNEPAYIFSSAVHGDPSTPLFRAYAGDPVIFRFMGGAHEEGHNFTVSGHRWLHEPDDPNSNLYDSQFVMISEFFNFEVSGTQVVKRGTKDQAVERAREVGTTESGGSIILPTGAGAPGDYIYSSQPLNDLWMGMWGIFRVQAARTPDLQPLPTRTAPATAMNGSQWPAVKPGEPLRPPLDNPKPCPTTAVQRTYNVSLVNTRIDYNEFGDHDPNGVAYVLDQDLDSAGRPKAGTTLRPLFIRAAENECLNLVLTNRLPERGVSLGVGDPVNPVERIGNTGTSHVANLVDGRPERVTPTWPAGNRASIHPSGLIRYSVIAGDGSAVGYNFDSTVGPGQKYTYKYLVDSRNIGVANLGDWGNLRTTRHHGAWGALIAEPKDATFHEPESLSTLRNGAGEQAVVRYTDSTGTVRAFREFVVDIQDGLNLFDAEGEPIVDQFAGENEDMGEIAVNYRNAPFDHRLAGGGDIADVVSSRAFGDPMTPMLRAYPNEPVMVRILNSQDLPRVHSFGMSGHAWRYEQNDPNSNIVTSQGGLNTGRAFNAGICAGSVTPMHNLHAAALCDGTNAVAGDFLYNDRNFFHMFSGGAWGIVRVHGQAQADLRPLSDVLNLPKSSTPPKKK
ncbi:hypothetical protein GA707_19210 [Nostocoides sp. F2B08]|uniref:hypothetical protein n=1 Tax=Nostocoides sp. F2B08 TaxID=2653936 RepID=UPI001262EDB7|nr:hypothetical protein [Tetrasphaera sp. F2B08]KAB7740627.1 hypothetical protein GA707_19210 [Tetrasphaera sp. F2B08]